MVGGVTRLLAPCVMRDIEVGRHFRFLSIAQFRLWSFIWERIRVDKGNNEKIIHDIRGRNETSRSALH